MAKTLGGQEQEEIRQPPTLWLLSIIFALSAWGFANLVSSLTLYLKQVGFSTKSAYDIYAAFAALLWVIPMLGGYLSQYLGYLLCSYLGLLCCSLAMLSLWLHIPTHISYALTLYLVGNGFFTPALWCLVDHIYPKEGENRRIGFTFFYIIFNLGGVLGIFVGGFVATKYLHNINYLMNAVLCIIAMLMLTIFQKQIKRDMVRPPNHNIAQNSLSMRIALGVFATVLLSSFVLWMLYHTTFSQVFLLFCVGLAAALLLRLAAKQTNPAKRQKIFAFIVIAVAAFMFWSLYNLEPSLLSIFADNYVNRNVGGVSIPATVFFGFACVSAILMGLLLNRIWLYCAKYKKQVGLLLRVSLGLLLMGLGYLYLMLLIIWSHYHLISVYAYIVCYALFTCGELFIGPLGISMSGELSPQGQEGLFMGSWQLVVGVSAVLSDYLSQRTIPSQSAGWLVGMHGFATFFMWIGIASVITAIIFFCGSWRFDKWLAKLHHRVENFDTEQ